MLLQPAGPLTVPRVIKAFSMAIIRSVTDALLAVRTVDSLSSSNASHLEYLKPLTTGVTSRDGHRFTAFGASRREHGYRFITADSVSPRVHLLSVTGVTGGISFASA